MIEIQNANDMVITKDDGTQQLLKILFYFHNDQRGKDYYFLYEEGNEDEVIVMASSDGESLEELSEEEFDEAEQVFDAYQEDPAIQELKDSNPEGDE